MSAAAVIEAPSGLSPEEAWADVEEDDLEVEEGEEEEEIGCGASDKRGMTALKEDDPDPCQRHGEHLPPCASAPITKHEVKCLTQAFIHIILRV